MRPRSRACSLCLVVFALACAAGRAQELDGRAIVGYSGARTNAYDSDAFTQTYELRWQKVVSSMIQYRLALIGQEDLGVASSQGRRSDLEFRRLHPNLEYFYLRESLALQLEYDLQFSQNKIDWISEQERLQQRMACRLNYGLTEQARLNLDVLHTVDSTSGAGAETRETQLRFGGSGEIGKLSLQQSNQFIFFNDVNRDFTRRTVSVVGQLAYQDSFYRDRLAIMASEQVLWSWIGERNFGAEAASIARRERPTQGLHGVDDTPLDDTDHPLAPVASLVDENVAVNSGISLGPDGTSHQNFALDMGRVLTLDELRVMVRTAAGELVVSGGDITWEAYTSYDGIFWTQAIVTAARFEPARSEYEIGFVPTTGRFFKVVNFGVSPLETLVVELEAYVHDFFVPGIQVSHTTVVNSATAMVTATLTDWLRLDYNGAINLSHQVADDQPTFNSLDWMHSAGITSQPTEALIASVRYDNRLATQTGATETTYNAVTGTVSLSPNRNLSGSLQAQHLEQDQAGSRSNANQLGLRGYLAVYRVADLALDTGYARQQWTTPQAMNLDRVYLSGTSNTQLTRTLKLTLALTTQRNTYDQPEDATIGPVAGWDNRYSGEILYRPSQQLGFAALLGYAAAGPASGLMQRYRLDWYPFPGGALWFGMSYDQDIQPYSRQRFYRFSLFPRWTINRYATLNLSYTLMAIEGAESSRSQFFMVTLNLRS